MIAKRPLFGIGLHGKSPDVTANKLVNAYYEFQQEADGTRVAIYGTPGLTEFLDVGDTPWRGIHTYAPNSLMYGVHRNNFYQINNAGLMTSRGTIGTSEGRVDITDDGDKIAVVDGQEIYVYDPATPDVNIAAVADADRPDSPNTCTFQAGRIITDEDGTGEFHGSGAYAPTTWAALDYATAESHPDNTVRVINYRGTLVVMGTNSIEYFQNVGGSGFPYATIAQATQEVGLAARWSVGRFAGSYAFLAQNREGQVFIATFNGFQAQRISNFELDHLINNYGTVGDASGFGYLLGGHAFYQINFPTEGKSWLYDGSTKYWSELRYGSSERHRAEMGTDFLYHTIVTDYENGKMYRLDANTYTDNGDPIHTILRGRHIEKNRKVFKIGSIELGMEHGVGLATGQGSEPVAGLRLSKDGGHSWGTQTFAPMGKVGEYRSRCIWRRLGRGRDIVPEVTITDPVKRVITDAVMNLEEGIS